jgi:hypothetical protein
MAVYIIDGKIGSGKTYYAVYHILKKYYHYDEILDEYFPRKNLVLISNIDGLKLEHIALDAEVEKHGLEYVFSEQYVNSLRDGRKFPIIFLIDEAQSPKFFHRKYYNERVFYFFQYSRHYGVDAFLITQDVDSLAKEIRVLPEYTIHAVSRTHTTGYNFQYKFISNDEVTKTKFVKIDKSVFRVYKSFNFDETEKPKPVYIRYFIFIAAAFICAILAFKFIFLSNFGPKNNKDSESAAIAQRYNLEVRKENGKDVYYTKYGKKVELKDGKIQSVDDPVSSQPITAIPAQPINSMPQYPPIPLDKIAPLPQDSKQDEPKFTAKNLRNYDFILENCEMPNSVVVSARGDDISPKTVSLENFICGQYEVSYQDKRLLSFSKIKEDKRPDMLSNTFVSAPPLSQVSVGGESERRDRGL